MKIVISGGSGLVGNRLRELAELKGMEVFILSRDKEPRPNHLHWDVDHHKLDANSLEGFDAVIHLAGAGIADEKWSEKRKRVILESRTKSADLLLSTLEKVKNKPKMFISSSAIGYYGNNPDKTCMESDVAGSGFLAEVCKEWEEAVQPATQMDMKLAIVRTGIVLSTQGGALPKLITPVKWGVGSPLGSGKQWMSWIHLDDLCGIFLHLLENEQSGVYNGVAPFPEQNKPFVMKLAQELNKPLILPPVPEFILKLIMGDMSAVVLEGQKVSSEKIAKSGFEFQFSELDKALSSLVKKH